MCFGLIAHLAVFPRIIASIFGVNRDRHDACFLIPKEAQILLESFLRDRQGRLRTRRSAVMIRHTRNASYSEWVAVGIEWTDLTGQLQAMDDTLRRRLISDYVRPGDHFLPLGVLSLSVGSVSQLTIDDLRQFSGVGLVKIRNLLRLLRRVVESKAKHAYDVLKVAAPEAGSEVLTGSPTTPTGVAEVEWSQWREELRDLPIIREPIGRYVSRLEELPSGSWLIPISEFSRLSLRELRELPGYGPRRVDAIITAFWTLVRLRSAVAHLPEVSVSMESREIARADAWLVSALSVPGQATYSGLQSEVLESLMHQIRHDLGADHLDGDRSCELSKSRIRQIHRDVATAIHVRWPRGEQLARAFLKGVATTWAVADVKAAAKGLGVFFKDLSSKSRRPDDAFSHASRNLPAQRDWKSVTRGSSDPKN